MRASLRYGTIATALFLGATTAHAQLCQDEPPLKNHTGSVRQSCSCFVPSEQAGTVFNLPASAFPLEILKVRVGWGSQFGGAPASLEQALHIYQGGLPNPGTPIFTLPGPTLHDGALNEFDLESSPGPVLVNSGPFTVTVEFLNQSAGNPFAPSVVHDNNGCQTGRNAVLAQPGGWADACQLGVTGDWVFEVVYRPVTCARCPQQPPLLQHTGASRMPCNCFVPNEQAGAVLTIPAADLPAEIVKVRVGWGTQFGGAPASTEQALHIYQGGLPNPGTPIFTIPGPTLVDGGVNEFDLEPSPGAVVVNTSPVTVTVEFLNQSAGNPFAPSVVHDNNGCQLGKNAVLAQPGGWADACPLGVTGDWVFELDYKPISCAGPVRIPDGDRVPGTPLTLDRLSDGDVKLDWGGSCSTSDTDYVVYEGTLGDFDSHDFVTCSTAGLKTYTLTPESYSTYYLVAPTDGVAEGSYGVDSDNRQRALGNSYCMTQQIGSCP